MNNIALTMLRRMQNIFVRGIYQSRSTDGSLTAQQLSGETSSGMKNPQNYGFASKGVGGKTYTICNGGNRDSATVILHELEGAPTLADNEVAVWNNQGAKIVLKNDGTIELQGSAFGGLIKIDELTTEINKLVTQYNSHTHNLTIPYDNTPDLAWKQIPLVKTAYENTGVNHG